MNDGRRRRTSRACRPRAGSAARRRDTTGSRRRTSPSPGSSAAASPSSARTSSVDRRSACRSGRQLHLAAKLGRRGVGDARVVRVVRIVFGDVVIREDADRRWHRREPAQPHHRLERTGTVEHAGQSLARCPSENEHTRMLWLRARVRAPRHTSAHRLHPGTAAGVLPAAPAGAVPASVHGARRARLRHRRPPAPAPAGRRRTRSRGSSRFSSGR